MNSTTEKAYAKINLSLDVGALRPDGYHEMDMVMQSVSLCDVVTLTLTDSDTVTCTSDRGDLPSDKSNLAVKAAYCFYEALGIPTQGLHIDIEKHIPVCAGTAGGSSDAAAVLRGLNRLFGEKFTLEKLMKLGEQVGSDVPYCVLGKTARATGRGEILETLTAMPSCHILLCKPNFPIATPALFRRIDEEREKRNLTSPDVNKMILALKNESLEDIAQSLGNMFYEVLEEKEKAIVENIGKSLVDFGALGAQMTGTGPTVFGIFPEENRAKLAMEALQKDHEEVFLAKTV